jgi:hypothetical protein
MIKPKNKNKVPAKYSNAGYSVWPIRRTISEAVNISRWNPWLAHAWMEEARNQLSLDNPFYSEYNQAVERINQYWLNMRNFIWFDETEFWALNGETYPLTLLTEI